MKKKWFTALLTGAAVMISSVVGVISAQAVSTEEKTSSYTIEDIRNLQDFLLNRPTEQDLSEKDYDLDNDGKWTVFDLSMMKHQYINDNKSENEQKNLVVYYSASGTTETIANYIINATNADTFVITPAQEYTSDDLNWTNQNSRVVTEHNDPNRHTELVSIDVPNWESYDNVFIGYPIWWQEAAWVVDDFVKCNDFTGKNVIPFCTSMSSPLGESGTKLAEMAGSGNWLEGMRFTSRSTQQNVTDWVNSLNLTKPETVHKNLVVYHSASGTTERVANYIAEEANADIFVITPSQIYTDEDLNWTNENSRVVVEYQNPNRHTELVSIDVPNWESYDNVFIGYPIWWYEASWVVDDFVKGNDFTGKTVIPFCTSYSSPFGDSGEKLAEKAGTGNWIDGKRFTISSTKQDAADWVSSLAVA